MSDLEVNQAVLNVLGCGSCKVGIQVSKPTNHDIMFKNCTVLWKLQLVKSVTLLEVVHKELPEQKEADFSEGTGGASCKVGIQVSNPTNHDIELKNRTVLGKLQLVKSVTLLEVVHKELPEQKEADLSEDAEPESTPVNDIERHLTVMLI